MPILGGASLAVITGLFWATAIIVVRYSGAPAAAMPLIVSTGSFIAVLPTAWWITPSQLGGRALAIAFVGALLNGIGMAIGWKGLIGGAAAGRWELSVVIPIAYACIPLFVAMESFVFFGDRFGPNKIAGIALAMASIWFLYRK